MPVKNVQDLLLNELRDIYDAEKQLVRALPKMAKGASSEQLWVAFQEHLAETKNQVERLEQVFEKLDTRPRGKRCEAMRGLVEEASEMMEEIKTPQVLDAALIAGAQKVEHYEIATYGSVRALAEACGHQEVAQLLDVTLEEEKEADQKLNQIALSEGKPGRAGSCRLSCLQDQPGVAGGIPAGPFFARRRSPGRLQSGSPARDGSPADGIGKAEQKWPYHLIVHCRKKPCAARSLDQASRVSSSSSDPV
jgi:ferritin-like metal-binding protein YciE